MGSSHLSAVTLSALFLGCGSDRQSPSPPIPSFETDAAADTAVVQSDKLGPPCTGNAFNCPDGMSCYSYRLLDSALETPRCVPYDKQCEPVRCAASTQCTARPIFPGEVVCSSDVPTPPSK